MDWIAQVANINFFLGALVGITVMGVLAIPALWYDGKEQYRQGWFDALSDIVEVDEYLERHETNFRELD